MGPSLRNLTDKELVRYFDQSNSPELREAADRLQELAQLRHRLKAVEEELADIAEELATHHLHAA